MHNYTGTQLRAVLIHNAAGGQGPFELTEDKLEPQMAISHFGPFLFTKLVTSKLLGAGSADYTPHVVFVSSASEGYSWAKFTEILTAAELSCRAKGRINAYGLHPGAIFTNIQQREESIKFFKAAGIITADGRPNPAVPFEWKTIPQGAAITVAASLDTRLDVKPGTYLWDGMAANDKMSANSTVPPGEGGGAMGAYG
ncbi:hypothetical protein DFH07DRAFT_963861 [Mycena maculata]|uniref:Short-chain dehydrogenase n=1 Tax=Mycena maculata TaxID=230809 RepID=A0AAD7IK41_9AGAR|nr:hypothetical protein DFH07DRAFT_963861 [Mycena maculata]